MPCSTLWLRRAVAHDDAPKLERVAKRIARSGHCSRRDAERLIASGRVAVDGEVLKTPAVTVTDANRITIDGAPLADPEQPRLFRYHKPAGVLTAARDPEGRATIYDRLPESLPRLMPIGRLDMGSEGLLLLTNDGELKRRLELPTTGWLRRYRVRVHGQIDESKLEGLHNGIVIDGFQYGRSRRNSIGCRAATPGLRSPCAKARIGRSAAYWSTLAGPSTA